MKPQRVHTKHSPTKAELEARVKQLESQTQSKGSNGRSFLTGLLILISVGFLVSSISAYWVRQTLFDTNTWVKKTTEIMKNSSVQTDIANQTVNGIFAKYNVTQYVSDLLPQQAKPLAAPITSSLQNVAIQQTQKVLASDQFQQFWENANRQAHTGLVKSIQVLNNKSQASAQDEVIYINQDQVILNLEPILQNVKSALSNAGLGFVNNINVSGFNQTITLATVSNLPTILLAINTINALAFWLPVLTILFVGLTLWVSKNRRKTLMHLGIVAAVLFVINILLINLTGYGFVANLSHAINGVTISTASGQAIYSALTNDLLTYNKIGLGLVLILVIFTYLTGTSVAATWIRDTLSGLFTGHTKTPALKWLGEHAVPIVGILVALTALIVVFAPFSSIPFAFTTSIIIGILCIVLLSLRAAVLKPKRAK